MNNYSSSAAQKGEGTRGGHINDDDEIYHAQEKSQLSITLTFLTQLKSGTTLDRVQKLFPQHVFFLKCRQLK